MFEVFLFTFSLGKLSLLCLGPLTNVALAIRLDPKFLENLKEIFVLGGSDSGKLGIYNHILYFFSAETDPYL